MTATDLQQGDLVRATFQPQRSDDLRPGAAAWIGRRLLWQALWQITPEDGGNYVGQWAMGIYGDLTPAAPFVWVPFCDLADSEEVPRDQR